MRSLQRFYREVNLLNVIIFAAIIALAAFAVAPLFNARVKFTLPAAKTKIAAKQETPAANTQTPSPSDYAAIAENNLFHPERRTPKEEKPLPKPELVLYGTIVGDGASIAYIEDKKSPKTTPGRGKRQTSVKKGDVIGGFVLKEIETDRIVLTRGEETMVIYLADAGKQRDGSTTSSPSKAPTPTQPPSVGLPTGPDPGTLLKPAPAPAASVSTPALPSAPAAQTPPIPRGRGIGR
ncbi:MAG TPA: type II secretion system protein N [Syntrophorhabdaceae bacterium]|nr:type II secretion system protein N [Syntrophorhabdaceae bacterium]